MLPILYSRTSNGAIQKWKIIVDGNSYRTVEGLVDGKLTIKEASAKWKKKVDSGYYEDISLIDNIKFVEPMLAKNFDDEFTNDMFPVYCQPKFDGGRCVISKKGMFSRNGKEILSAPHIFNSLKPFFDKFPNIILDGELYCHKLHDNFNKIISLIKKTKPIQSDLDESEKFIKYYVYDTVSNDSFNNRFNNVWKLLKENIDTKYLVEVETFKVESRQELDELYGKFMSDGYEGQMIRLDKPYENKRSKYLLKRKEFKDSEFTIVDICEGVGNRSSTAGYMILKLDEMRKFKSNIKGTFSYLKELLDNKQALIGKQATVKYFCLTPDGVPRFPYVIAIRDYE